MTTNDTNQAISIGKLINELDKVGHYDLKFKTPDAAENLLPITAIRKDHKNVWILQLGSEDDWSGVDEDDDGIELYTDDAIRELEALVEDEKVSYSERIFISFRGKHYPITGLDKMAYVQIDTNNGLRLRNPYRGFQTFWKVWSKEFKPDSEKKYLGVFHGETRNDATLAALTRIDTNTELSLEFFTEKVDSF